MALTLPASVVVDAGSEPFGFLAGEEVDSHVTGSCGGEVTHDAFVAHLLW